MKQVISETLIHILSLLAAVFRSVKPDQIPDELKEYFKGINLVFKREFIENNTDREIFHSLLSQPLEQKLKMISDYFENLCGKTDIILQDRIIMLLHIIRYVTKNSKPDPQINTVLKILSDKMNLTQDQFDDLFKFTTLEKADDLQSDHFLILSSEIKKDENLLEGSWIENNIPSRTGSVNAIETDSFKGTLIFVYLPQLKSFIVKKAETDFHKNPMLSDDYQMFDILGPGDELRLNNDFALEYHEIKKKYLQCITKNSIRIAADKIEYYYNPPVKGIKEFSFKEETGELIGIVGQDGVGKTTLLKLIAGEMKPDKGTISINGFDLNENNYLLKGILGNVTESDMLFDELTVYENIYLAAKFFFSSLSEQNLKMKISDLMDEIGLTTISNVQVGSFSDKNIQPGQRRLVNIALELLREPDILLVDDAIERLSMSDTSKVIKVLHHYTFKGKLVITTISQTSESVFRMFDKIWIIDEGGYPIFQGSPMDALNYFSREVNQAAKKGNDSIKKNVSPEAIFDLINTKTLDNCGNESLDRKFSPEDWYNKYRSYQQQIQAKTPKSALPRGFLKTPNLETQFKYYSIRNFRTKFKQKRMLFTALLVGPLTAMIIGLILRKKEGSEYLFSANVNLPEYFYISILISFFFGLIISAGEILKEKQILKKEEYLNFSRFSYINSKITFLFIIAGIQTLLYTITGNIMLGIRGMMFYYWFLLFSMAGFGVILGLIFSSTIRTNVIIYGIAIPVALTLQFILGGGYVSYKNLNMEESGHTPMIGDIMPARWAYEAMVVKQFRDNKFEKNFYDLDRTVSQSSYLVFHLLPELQKSLIFNPYDPGSNDTLKYNLKLIREGITQVVNKQNVFPFEYYDQLYPSKYTPKIAEETSAYLTYLEYYFYDSYDTAQHKKVAEFTRFTDSLGMNEFQDLKNKYYNSRLADMVTDNPADTAFVIRDTVPIQVTDPIYQSPMSNNGRASMFLPDKMLNGELIDTYWFNVTVIWLFSFVIYVLLLIDLINKTGLYLRKRMFTRDRKK